MAEKDFITEHIERGEDPMKMLVDYTASFFRYTVLAWFVLDEEYEYDKASEIQRAFTWGGKEFGDSFRAFMKTLDYEVNDIQSLGKAGAAHYCTLPIPLYVAESSDEKVVLDADFCTNPAFNGRPWDRPIDQYRYHYADGWVGTCDLFKNYFKILGLDKELDFHMECAICIGQPKCRFVIEKLKNE